MLSKPTTVSSLVHATSSKSHVFVSSYRPSPSIGIFRADCGISREVSCKVSRSSRHNEIIVCSCVSRGAHGYMCWSSIRRVFRPVVTLVVPLLQTRIRVVHPRRASVNTVHGWDAFETTEFSTRSCKFSPTPGRSATRGIRCSASSDAGPTPLSFNSCGVFNAPPARMISLAANATPVDRLSAVANRSDQSVLTG